MPPKDDDERDLDTDLEEKNEDLDTDNPNTSEDDDEPTPDSTDWEKSYKGLQRSSVKKQEKLQGEIDALSKTIEKLSEDLEGEKTGSKVLIKQLDDAKKNLEELQGSLETVNQEKTKLDGIVERAKVISQEFPKLGPMQQFIPQGNNIEEYRENVKEFMASLEVYTDTFVSEDLAGATPPPPSREEQIDETEEDRLWSIISATAGDPTKQKEYDEAYSKWLKIQSVKKQQ